MTQVAPLEDTRANGIPESKVEVTELEEKIEPSSDEDGEETGQEATGPPQAEESAKARRRRYCTIFKAVLTRLLFLAHSLVAVWRAAEVAGMVWWALLVPLAGLLIEGGITICVRKGKEYRW